MNPVVDVLALGLGCMLGGGLWLVSEDFFDHYGVTPWAVPSECWPVLVLAEALVAAIEPSATGLAALLGAATLVLWMLARVSTWYSIIEERTLEQQRATERALASAWLADPSGRHQRRYFDGRGFTEWVHDFGVTSRDPLPAGELPAPA